MEISISEIIEAILADDKVLPSDKAELLSLPQEKLVEKIIEISKKLKDGE